MGKISNTIGLAKISWGVLRKDRELLAILPVAVLLFITGALGTAAFVIGIVIAVVWVATAMVVLSALGAVFQTALYLYATTGTIPTGFEQSSLSESFRAK